jgi:hypothetical protein
VCLGRARAAIWNKLIKFYRFLESRLLLHIQYMLRSLPKLRNDLCNKTTARKYKVIVLLSRSYTDERAVCQWLY